MESLTNRFYKETFIPYIELLKSRYRFHPLFASAKKVWEEKLSKDALIKGPYLERSQVYAPGQTLENLSLHDYTIAAVIRRLGKNVLYKHQSDAIQNILAGNNVVVATGTSSGKTLCYQTPILDDLFRNPSPGLRAVIIYPLNALVNDQLGEWEHLLTGHPKIRFARFSGQTPGTQKEYEERVFETFKRRLEGQKRGQQDLQREAARLLREKLRKDAEEIPNRLNHREAIRENPPHILITNFSMLEYLLDRPIDASIFEGARLKFLVLDEAHAYRGVQATEIGFLLRRLRSRLGVEKLSCIATSATLGKANDSESMEKVRRFATNLFGELFSEPNPIYGTPTDPEIQEPRFRPTPEQYIKAVQAIRSGKSGLPELGLPEGQTLAMGMKRDENLYLLRKTILSAPKLLQQASKELWDNKSSAEDGLLALLEIVSAAKLAGPDEDLLPARLHYFVRAEDGLHMCLNPKCPGRSDGAPAVFVSRSDTAGVPNGSCPACWPKGSVSQLVELVSCRKCGYLFGALQDLGPRRHRNWDLSDIGPKPCFDSFSTELGWSADSFWTYFSVQDELPYPPQPKIDDEEINEDDLITNPSKVPWCISCGKRKYNDDGDDCKCSAPTLRDLWVFHRQCPYSRRSKDLSNLDRVERKSLGCCPNCGAKSPGLEPVRRFQESDDEVGLAMAIPLAHFAVSPTHGPQPRKLLCFTDHRQRAAAFPSLLEEETFGYDMGRKIIRQLGKDRLTIVALGERLADCADPTNELFDPRFFLPISRKPDEQLDRKGERDLWLAEVFSYFGIPDSARESAEDFGLVTVEYDLSEEEINKFHKLLHPTTLSRQDSVDLLQTLLTWARQRNIFTLPRGRVSPDSPAFQKAPADIALVYQTEGVRKTRGWSPPKRKDGRFRDNYVTDYLRRVLSRDDAGTFELAQRIWDFLTNNDLLINDRNRWRLDHQRIMVRLADRRYMCSKCGFITSFNANRRCPKKECEGLLSDAKFDAEATTLVGRWVSGSAKVTFSSLRSEEHTAQINKDLAKIIEDDFRIQDDLKGQGINLLSSTTTFEMGINIGDLQKILMRNAPPTSASYIQRVGRAGRGKDKNAVCVTMCRRTKYDADIWIDPSLLMSGNVRTPTVFIRNRIIAQRHFNAVVFSEFLRQKVKLEKLLGEQLTQKIRLESLVPQEARRNIPEDWIQKPAFLDFLGWMNGQKVDSLFGSKSYEDILKAVGGFEPAKTTTISSFSEVMTRIFNELASLVSERLRLVNVGAQISLVAEIQHSIIDMLGSSTIDVLATEGFLPRYAFPLDVVTLETGATRWSSDSDVELSRDRGIAIAEFAPGAQVIAHKRVFTSAGLYILGNVDRPKKQWFSKCPGCEQIRTALVQEELRASCSVCNRSITTQYIVPFVEPKAFSIEIDPKGRGAQRYRKGTLIRQRQAITQFIDTVENSDFEQAERFRLAIKEEGKLFRYNLGVRGEGFVLCQACGFSEPQATTKVERGHRRLRALSEEHTCGAQPWKGISYGHVFQSYCLIARPTSAPGSIESVAFGLQQGICHVLDVESHDIGVSWRWLGQKTQQPQTEIVFYDLTPGGAGFVKEASEAWNDVLQAAKKICDQCQCNPACYDCLKSYSNQAHHDRLRRSAVQQFLS